MKQDVLAELDAILAKDGTLTPQLVLARARDESSPLHSHFTWDDSEAAERYRLDEARRLIVRVKVEIQTRPNEAPTRVRAFTSLMSDRMIGGGYRSTVTVLADMDQRSELLRTALAELQAFQRKYRHLSELTTVMHEIDRARAAHDEAELDRTA